MSINFKTASAVCLQYEIKKLGLKVTGVEVGVWTGVNMAHFLEECSNIEMLYGIDPYQPYQDWNAYLDFNIIENAKKQAIHNLSGFKDRSKILITTSENAAPNFNMLDFIFIDGDHSFAMCFKDLNLWYDKIRPGGLFAGHDFSLTGVNEALHQFRKQRNIKGFFKVIPNDVWYWIKD